MSEVSNQPDIQRPETIDEFLNHHGIKGMKWGVRRTPEQLGHATARKQPSGENKTAKKVPAKKTPGKSARSSSSLSDDELQRRINRLNMEERYEDLVARQKARGNTGFKATAKKLVGNAAEDLGRQLLSKAVSKLVDRIAGDKLDDYIIDDPSQASTEQLKKAVERYNALRNYEEARNPKKNEKTKTRTDYDSPLDLDDETLGKVVKRMQSENSFYAQQKNRTVSDILEGRGPVQDALAKMMTRDRDDEV